ncbi:MAG: M15 family metallopeptidase [Bacteroidetes bacterium]|nr:M15 family metallopeptidase [Bacteroidota bacterium]
MRIAVFQLIYAIALITTGCVEHDEFTQKQSIAGKQPESNTERLEELPDSLERYLITKGLTDVGSLDSTIHVALHYSTEHNFLGKPMYQGLKRCYLPCEVAIKLCNAQWYLKQQYPYYSIVVFDAVRPLSIQKNMWDELDMPASKKINYLAHPSDLSLHNYGAAVDVGIISNDGVLLNMGTAFDSFDSLSEPKWETHFLALKKLDTAAYKNRMVLRRVMLKAGFTAITSEWWHFNATDKSSAALKYLLIE